LKVLQGVQRTVLQAQWIRGHWLVDGLLEGFLLQLHKDPVGLLPLRLTLLGCLPSAAENSIQFIYIAPNPNKCHLKAFQ